MEGRAQLRNVGRRHLRGTRVVEQQREDAFTMSCHVFTARLKIAHGPGRRVGEDGQGTREIGAISTILPMQEKACCNTSRHMAAPPPTRARRRTALDEEDFI